MSDEAKVIAVRSGLPVIGFTLSKLQSVRRTVNFSLCYEPIVLIGGTALIVHFLHSIYGRIPLDGAYEGLRRYFFKTMRRIPSIRNKINAEILKYRKSMNKDMCDMLKGDAEECQFLVQLPYTGLKTDDILDKIKDYMKLGHYSWQTGSVSGTVYHGGNELTEMNTKVYELSAWANPLHPDVFPGVCKMEAEIVRMVRDLFHGDSKCCGTMTSGGTESIILAMKAYRDYAKEVKGISYPEILVPKTGHAAFEKSAQLLNIGIRFVPVNKATCKVDIKTMKKMINGNTCVLVGSTPAYPHGCIDDIQKIAELGLKYNIPVHVDACLGGFLLAFMPKAGYPVPPFDFRVPGVTSISADTHKYGFAPKGSSVLLFSEHKYKHFQYFVQPNWPGGLYGSPTLAGSRPGAIIAGCWSTLQFFGMNGYVETTRRIIKTARTIEEGLRNIRGIYVMGSPQVSVIALASDTFDILRLSDALNKKGWCLNNLQFPSSVHICLTYCHTEQGVAEKFINDVESIVSCLMKDPGASAEGAVAMYGAAQQIPDRSIIAELTEVYLESLYNTETSD